MSMISERVDGKIVVWSGITPRFPDSITVFDGDVIEFLLFNGAVREGTAFFSFTYSGYERITYRIAGYNYFDYSGARRDDNCHSFSPERLLRIKSKKEKIKRTSGFGKFIRKIEETNP